MGWLVGGLVEALVVLLCKLIGGIMSWVTGAFNNALGADPTVFMQMFPITEDLQIAFKAIGFGLCIGLIMLGCLRNMMSGLGFAGENPFKMFFRFFVAVVFTYTLPEIMSYFYTKTNGGEGLFQTIYDGVNTVDNTTGNGFGAGFFDIVGGATNIVTGGTSKIIVSLILLILMTVIGINFLKLLVEMFERYLMVNLLIFFSPLSASAITLESTMKIFSSYMKMFFGQMVMLLMNLVSLKIILSGFTMATDVIGGSLVLDDIDSQFMPFIALFLVIAMLKVLQRVDNYARDIGLTVGVTGGSLVDDIVGTAAMFKPVMGALTGGAIGGKRGGGPGGAAGASTGGVLGSMARHSPIGYWTRAASSIGGGIKNVRGATGNSNANLMDVFKHYGKNGGMKALGEDFAKGTKDDFNAKMGVSGVATSSVANTVLEKVAPEAAEKNRQSTVNSIRNMMVSSSTIPSYTANARSTQSGFQNFANDLKPSDGFVAPSVGVNDLSNVSVGNGGALGTNSDGDLVSISTYQPADTDAKYTAEYKDSEGNSYWVQNLSKANDISLENNNGKEYAIYTKAQRALNTGSTNFDFEGKANRNNHVPNPPAGSAEKSTSAVPSKPEAKVEK